MNTPVPSATVSTPIRFSWDTPLPIGGFGAALRQLEIQNNSTWEKRRFENINADGFNHDEPAFYSSTQYGFKWRSRIVRRVYGIPTGTFTDTVLQDWSAWSPFNVSLETPTGIGGPGGTTGLRGERTGTPGGTLGGTLGGSGTPTNTTTEQTSSIAQATIAGFPVLGILAIGLLFAFLQRK